MRAIAQQSSVGQGRRSNAGGAGSWTEEFSDKDGEVTLAGRRAEQTSAHFSPETIQAGLRHLQSVDPVMGDLIQRVGPFTLKLERNRFGMLVRSIISQQLSTKAARTIRKRVQALVPQRRLTPDRLASLSFEDLQSAGLSGRKATYLLDLAHRVREGALPMRRLGRLPDDEVIRHLTQVKGIGRWTAQMFLIFALGRLDVFPHDDLGIRSALESLYELDELPDRQRSQQIAEPWHPYATIASWYCWRLGDLERNEQDFATGYPV